jgi:predicted O-methyltransferase YrrM
MSQDLWTAVDDYVADTLALSDPILDEVLQANAAAGLPAIDVTPNQRKFLQLLVRMHGAKRILEIGTLGAYSTIWLARALPSDGLLVTLESNPNHAAAAAKNLARAGVSSVVDLRLGPALDSLAQLHQEGAAAFDFIFIDADKQNNPGYLEWSLRLSRPGTVILTDNVVREGAVADPETNDPRVKGVRRFFEMMAADARLDATAIQTVGSKGYDGFALALVKSL